MMKRIKENLKNKKGFTLVELIVVIVIILVLSAVMVPSVLRYIDKANQANTKSDAAAILTQVQAETAEKFGTDSGYSPQNIIVQGLTVTPGNASAFSVTGKGSGPKAEYFVDMTSIVTRGEVIGLAYQDGKHFIYWTSAGGWSDIDATTVPTPAAVSTASPSPTPSGT